MNALSPPTRPALRWHAGYASPLYDSARPRTEVLWLNPAAVRAQDEGRLL